MVRRFLDRPIKDVIALSFTFLVVVIYLIGGISAIIASLIHNNTVTDLIVSSLLDNLKVIVAALLGLVAGGALSEGKDQ